jgi:hypothetical protein
MFLRHQQLMSTELLLANSIVLTLFMIILDHMFIKGHISPFQSLSDQYFNEEDIIDLKKEIEKEEKKKKKEEKKEENKKKMEKQKYKEVEKKYIVKARENETRTLQNIHDQQITNESKYINNNHPNVMNEPNINSDKCRNHAEYVSITNGLDNYSNTNNKSNRFNTYKDDLFPEYLAYNE